MFKISNAISKSSERDKSICMCVMSWSDSYIYKQFACAMSNSYAANLLSISQAHWASVDMTNEVVKVAMANNVDAMIIFALSKQLV